jgi:F0F1-type ATP synthase membrane subunit c/vacuolar-type H+-ATPase subunit K
MNQQRILWGALVCSTVIYVGVAYFIAPVAQRPFEESLRNPITLAMYGAAIATFIAGLMMPSLMAANAAARQKMILSMALFEACSVFGLVTAFIQHDWRLILAPWVASLIGFVRQWPSGDVNAA